MKFKLTIISILLSVSTTFAQTPVVTRALNHGMSQPQDRETLPVSRSTSVPKLVKTTPSFSPARLEAVGDNEYRIVSGWKMQEAGKVNETGELPLKKSFDTKTWYNATVPGTVLTTLVNEGVYPDPYHGLNNVLIPDTLCRQEWWYRVEIAIPNEKKSDRITLILNGINYRAEVWFNQKRLGLITGAFLRGQFDVTSLALYGEANVLAIRILPPQNPGIAQEESVAAGMGSNGGLLCLDGPTFFASEGWDWIPTVKDRNIGIWQDVCLRFSGTAGIGDPQIITDLPLPDTTKVDLKIKVPVINYLSTTQNLKVKINIENIDVEKSISLAPNEQANLTFSSSEFPQLVMGTPKIWWPNGYGHPNLYVAKISVSSSNGTEDHKNVRFGVREFEYQLCVSDQNKKKVDIEFNPTAAYQDGNPVFDQVNVVQFDVNGKTNYRPLLLCETNKPGISLVNNSASPYMVLKVNGVKIFCKGGNWGMDDAMKRVSRGRLEPYFKLQKHENFNMIRNWTGQNTEEIFFELCDEYGVMVFNDLWMSTADYNVAPADNRIFMQNLMDMVKRYRNHPSIAIWCARNEGFAPELLEKQITDLLVKDDGTRHYLGSSIKLNTTDSGPWGSDDPTLFSDTKSNLFAQGFKSEVGAPSIPTYRTMQKFISKEDLWPIGDVWSYHDWHVTGWLKFKRFQDKMDNLYGESKSAEEFCNWSQLENFRVWRAIGEAWNGNMWNNTTGFLLWMSHPSWPSTTWQTYSYDYETTGAYYACKKASEPLHIQMNLTSKKVQVINNSRANYDLIAKYTLYSLSGKQIKTESQAITVPPVSIAGSFDISTAELPEQQLSLLRLTLSTKAGKQVSTNDYWLQGKGCKDFQSLKNLGSAEVKIVKVTPLKDGLSSIKIKNSSKNLAVGVKLNLINVQTNEFVLPALFSDGFFSLLPGEEREIFLSDCKDMNKYKISFDGINLK